jgi:hypothetical protein
MAIFRREQRPIQVEPAINADELRQRLMGSRALDTDEQSSRLLGPGEFSEVSVPRPIQRQNEPVATTSKRPSQALDDSNPAKKPSPGDPVAKPNTIDGGDPMSQPDPPAGQAAVAKMFEPSKVFQDRLSKMSTAFDHVDRLGKDTILAFELVSELAEHLGQFAAAYAPVKAFHGEVSVLAEKFDPLKGIQNQLTEMSRSFHDHLNHLVGILEPASKMQERFALLAQAFEPAVDLKERFQELAREFEVLAGPTPPASASPTLGNGPVGKLQGAVAQRSQ